MSASIIDHTSQQDVQHSAECYTYQHITNPSNQLLAMNKAMVTLRRFASDERRVALLRRAHASA
eukprot:1599442-Pleurochrysis_carterae.AAC.1